MLKESENPPVIWPDVESIREFLGTWWVAHTRSRNEKALAHDLAAKKISYFLPMNWKVHRVRQRTVKSLLPLFAGYVFWCGDEHARVEILRTNRVANIIEVVDQETLVDQLVQIEHAIRAGAPLVPYKYVQTGQRCRVIAGPLEGLVGVVLRAKNATRLLLQVDMLGQAASVEINIDMIEVLE